MNLRSFLGSFWSAGLALILAASGLLGAAACKSGSLDGGGPTGRLTTTFRSEPQSFNRLVSPRIAEELFSRLTQATLVRVNRVTDQLEPRLAESWTTSADGLTWTLALRQGVAFSDGAPFTSADVLFSFQAVYDEKVGSAVASSLQVGGKPLSVRATDDHTLVVTFPAKYAPGLRMLDDLPIFPRHRLHAALKAGTFKEAWAVTTPPSELSGLGPFVLQEYVPGQRLVFARNPRFWVVDKDGRRLPYLDTIEVQVVPEQTAELVRLQSGAVDLINDAIRPDDVASLRQSETKGAVRLVDAGVSLTADGLWFNLTRGAAAAKGRPWLQREELRRAISHTVDRQRLVDAVYLGAAVPVFGPVTPGHGEWFVADLPKTEPDLARAKTLLASIGLTDRTGDGLLEDAAGKPARFSILTQKGHTIRERTVAVLQEQLRQVGLTVDVVPLDQGALFGRFSKRDYDAMYFIVSASSTDPTASMEFWLSSGSFHFWDAEQKKPATDWEATIDDLMRKQSTSLDRAERVRLFALAQRTLAAHLPILYFAAPQISVAMSTRVHGATPSVIFPFVLWNAEVLSIGSPAAGTPRQ